MGRSERDPGTCTGQTTSLPTTLHDLLNGTLRRAKSYLSRVSNAGFSLVMSLSSSVNHPGSLMGDESHNGSA